MAQNTSAATVLSHLSPEAQALVRAEVRAEVALELAGQPAVKTRKPRSEAKKVAAQPKARKSRSRQLTNDGTERNASQFIRDTDDAHTGDEPMKAKEVQAAAADVGLTIAIPLVYNVRKNRAKAEAKAAAAASAAADTSSEDVDESDDEGEAEATETAEASAPETETPAPAKKDGKKAGKKAS